MSDNAKLKLHVEFNGLKEDYEGSPDEVVKALLASLSKVHPSLELARKLVFQPDLAMLVGNLVGLVEFAPEGLLALTSEAPADEAILVSLVGSYVGFRLGKIGDETSSADELAKTTGKALKTISNQLAWMVDDGLVERVGRGKYRVTSLGIKRFSQIAEKLRPKEEK